MPKQFALNPNASLEKHEPFQKPRLKQDRAAWAVTGPQGFFDNNDKFWFPGQMLYFEGTPNSALIPLNKKAYDAQQLWLDEIDMFTEEKCKKDKVKFVKQPRQEWKEEEEMELPQVEHLMGVPRTTKNDEIK